MANESQAYEYSPIHQQDQTFRLIILHHGPDKDDISCQMFEANLDEEVLPYSALSYTWGTQVRNHRIILDGATLLVTENLLSALRHLRKENEDIVLWVDAICINQDSLRERSHQVQRMSEIYQKADQVIVWLGDPTTESNLIMSHLMLLQRSFRPPREQTDLNDFRREEQKKLTTTRRWVDQNADSSEMWIMQCTHRAVDPFLSLLNRPWFKRIWVVQEVYNAERVTIVCGYHAVSSRTVCQYAFDLLLRSDDVRLSTGECLQDEHWRAVLEVMPGPARARGWHAQNLPDLHSLLIKFRSAHASDPLDKIYALLGLCSDVAGSNLRADYEVSIDTIISRALGVMFSMPSQAFEGFWPIASSRRGEDDASHSATIEDFLHALPHLSRIILHLALEQNRLDIATRIFFGPKSKSLIDETFHGPEALQTLLKVALYGPQDYHVEKPDFPPDNSTLLKIGTPREVSVRALFQEFLRRHDVDIVWPTVKNPNAGGPLLSPIHFAAVHLWHEAIEYMFARADFTRWSDSFHIKDALFSVCKNPLPYDHNDMSQAEDAKKMINMFASQPNFDINTGSGNQTALKLAASSRNLIITQALMDYLCTLLNAVDDWGASALIIACSSFQPYVESLNLRNVYPRLPKIVKLLIDAGADVNLADKVGKTPLMKAIITLGRATQWKQSLQSDKFGILMFNWGLVVQELMASPRLDLSARDQAGSNALDIALSVLALDSDLSELHRVVTLLRERGLKPRDTRRPLSS